MEKLTITKHLVLWLVVMSGRVALGHEGAPTSADVVTVAARLLDEAQVSYVYGGYQLGDPADCQACNSCLSSKTPSPSARLKQCPVCGRCSLDCSHFTELVYREAGMPYPYLDTTGMLNYSSGALASRYHLVDVGSEPRLAAPGDLLVYSGHVVLLERLQPPVKGGNTFRGDVVHATGGKDVRRPGEGIQRERFVDLAHFRGPLLRILRHQDLVLEAQSVAPAGQAEDSLHLRKLRPVAKHQPRDD